MPSVLNQQSRIAFVAMMDSAPIPCLILKQNGQVDWMNKTAHMVLDTVVFEGSYVVPRPDDCVPILTQIKEGKPFFQRLGDAGFVWHPTLMPLVVDNEAEEAVHFVVWLVPSDTLEMDWTQLQQEWIRQRKLANMGRMVVEMVHEMSNPLASISMASQLLDMCVKKLRKRLEGLDELPQATQTLLKSIEKELMNITTGVTKAAQLREDLLTYSKPNSLHLKPYQLKPLLGDWIKEQRKHPLFKAMAIHYQPAKPSPTILCDPSKIEQILYNLIRNAHEASQGQADLWIREQVLTDEGKVIIEVEDNGPGIPKELLDKIFSPFQTTKKGFGSGLGLSISRDLITQHGGVFSVYNKPKSGACFLIKLPLFQPN